MSFLRKVFYSKPVNTTLSRVLRPFAGILPATSKFGVYGPFTLKFPGNIKVQYYTNPTSYHSKLLFWDGFEGFEYESSRYFAQLAKNANCFFDVGANIGYYSLLAGAVNPGITIFSFEPMPAPNAYLKRNLELNHIKNYQTSTLALSNTKTEAEFFATANAKLNFIADQLSGDGGMSESHSGVRSIEKVKVNTITLDEFAAKNLPQGKLIDLMKLDTEATEHYVLEGAANILAKHRPIIMCEVISGQIEKELEQILSANNYLYFRTGKGKPQKVNSLTDNTASKFEYFLVPAEKENMLLNLE